MCALKRPLSFRSFSTVTVTDYQIYTSQLNYNVKDHLDTLGVYISAAWARDGHTLLVLRFSQGTPHHQEHPLSTSVIPAHRQVRLDSVFMYLTHRAGSSQRLFGRTEVGIELRLLNVGGRNAQ